MANFASGAQVIVPVTGSELVPIDAGGAVVGVATVSSLANATQFGAAGSAAVFADTGQLSKQVNTGGVGLADTNEDTLFTYTLPANAFNIQGRGVIITATGSLAANAHTKTVRMYFGTGVTFTLTASTISGSVWQGVLEVLAGSAAGSQLGIFESIIGTAHQGAAALVVGTEATSAAIVIKVTGQTATAGTGDILANMFQVIAMN